MNLVHEFAQIGIDIRHCIQEVEDLIVAIYAEAHASAEQVTADGLDDIDEEAEDPA